MSKVTTLIILDSQVERENKIIDICMSIWGVVAAVFCIALVIA